MILTTTKRIAKTIKEILAARNGRRVAIAAFVGADALDFIGGKAAASGLEIYCWDRPGLTNPTGLRRLFKADARIYFVKQLHMKIFWSERGGYLLGSPNLSASALDGDRASNLLEIARYDPDALSFPIHNVLKQLHHHGVREVTSHRDIDDFADRCGLLPANHERDVTSYVTPSFDDYLADGGQAFSYCPFLDWVEYNSAERQAAVNARNKAFGAHDEPDDSLIRGSAVTRKGKHHKKWILSFRSRDSRSVSDLAWVYVHTEVEAGNSQKTKLEVKGIARPEAPPFDLKTSDFKKRFRSYLRHRYKDLLEAEGTFNLSDFLAFENRG